MPGDAEAAPNAAPSRALRLALALAATLAASDAATEGAAAATSQPLTADTGVPVAAATMAADCLSHGKASRRLWRRLEWSVSPIWWRRAPHSRRAACGPCDRRRHAVRLRRRRLLLDDPRRWRQQRRREARGVVARRRLRCKICARCRRRQPLLRQRRQLRASATVSSDATATCPAAPRTSAAGATDGSSGPAVAASSHSAIGASLLSRTDDATAVASTQGTAAPQA